MSGKRLLCLVWILFGFHILNEAFFVCSVQNCYLCPYIMNVYWIMRRKILCSLIALLLGGGNVYAQWSWRAVAGLGVSTVNGYKTKYELKSGMSYHIGAGASYDLGSGFSGSATLAFVTRSFETSGASGQNYYKTEYDATELELPVTVSYKINLPKNFFVSLYTGPVLGYGLGGSYETTVTEAEGGPLRHEGDFYGSESDSFCSDRFDLSWTVGAGVGLDRFMLAVDGTWGMTGHATYGDDGNKVRNARYALSLSYRF